MFRTQTNEDAFVGAVVRIAVTLERIAASQQIASVPPERTKSFYDIQQYLRAGQKIDAIKLFRELTGAGLKDAKDVIDRMGY